MKNNLVLQDYKANLLCELLFGNMASYAALSEILNATTLNGGFETAGAGGADVFANWTEYKASTSTITRDTSAQRTGAACCKFVINATSSEASLYQNILTVGKKYKVSFYAKVTVAGGTVWVKDSNSNVLYTSSALTTSYVKYEFTFVAPTTRFQIGSTSANKTIYIDDVVITPYEQEADLTGNYNAGVYGTLETEAILGKPALKIADALNAVIFAGNSNLNVGTGAKTYLMWVKPTTLGANNLLNLESNNITFGFNGANHYLYAFDVDEIEELEYQVAGATTGVWQLLGFYIDVPNLTCGIIKNGVVIGTHALAAGITSFDTDHVLMLGNGPQYDSPMTAYLKLFRVYNGVLEAHHLKNIYNFTKRQVLGLAPKD